MKRNVRVLVYPDEGGGYNMQCTDLGAYTQGDTLELALSNMREVLALAREDEDLNQLGIIADPSFLVEIEMGSLSADSPAPEIARAG